MAVTTVGGGGLNVMNKALPAHCGNSGPVEAQLGDTQSWNGIALNTPTTPLGQPTVDELELMHQFSTETYQSLCVSESEKRTWQVLIPRLALKHRFLMNSILALASLHIATTREPPDALAYIDAGLEYHSSSLEPFRKLIDSITPDNCDVAFAQAVVITAISLALPQLTAARENAFRMIDNIIMVFELLQGVKRILTIGRPWINLKLFSQGMFWKDGLGDLDTDTDAALNQLVILNEQANINSDLSDFRINKEVIAHLRHCFKKFSCSPDPAPVLAWLGAVDKEFIDNLRRREPFSLLILAHWGVLLKELDGQRWWARYSGRVLVSELMEELNSEDLLWETSLRWVKFKISSKEEELSVKHLTVTTE
ncbi:hypothetical protein N7462_007376 [Penicillium macrosclerotiorum]|uniref:uncharacterized protein n=1 Tax=Penicillium macrosclerotiorum TaxID=303699 RepID=UPI002549499B|nr:uncharacterized protein N7462_007376 [Penicillium macrosclerotiorum]KAJ5679132.1 hypothetical protein N7462_007376 [Penicillium macrosclerotiorum]